MSASDVHELKRPIMNEWAVHGTSESRCSLTCGWRSGASVYALVFALEADILTISCKKRCDLLQVWRFSDNSCQSCLWRFNDSLKCTCKYCVDASICHFKFPQVVLAYILVEVSTLCIVLLSINFGTCYHFFLLKLVHIWQTQSEKILGTFSETRCNTKYIFMYTLY